MTQFLRNLFSWNRAWNSREKKDHERLMKKAEKGTERAIKEYRKAFEKLAEYDRS